MGTIILLAWIAILIPSIGAAIVALIQKPPRRLTLLCPLGALLLLGFYAAAVGIADRAWTLTSPAFSIAVLIGVAGLALSFVGWRAFFTPDHPPGHCSACGYPLQSLLACPECGSKRIN